MTVKHVKPNEIEARSMELIAEELGQVDLPSEELAILKRVIHTTADFEYKHTLNFSKGSVQAGLQAIENGACFTTDTNMAFSGVNKAALEKLGCHIHCFMADEDVAKRAKEKGTTRACAAMEKAARQKGPLIFAVGNAPTALLELDRQIKEKGLRPALIIAVPVGFVNVVESKELILQGDVPCIVAKGRKGGSNVAAAICNALLYLAGGRSDA